METIKNIADTYYDVYQIPSLVINKENKTIYYNDELSKKAFEFSPKNYEYVNLCRDQNRSFITVDSLHLARAYIVLENQDVMVLGYVFLGLRNVKVLQAEIKNRNMEKLEGEYGLGYMLSIKQLMKTQFLQLVQCAYSLIYHKLLDTSNKNFIIDTQTTIIKEEKSIDIDNEFEISKIDYQYSFMKYVLGCVKTGNIVSLEQFLIYDKLAEQIHENKMNQNINDLVYFFYMMCSLSCQQAIESGLDYVIAITIKNNYFHRVGQTYSQEIVEKLLDEMLVEYTKSVSKLYRQSNYSYLTEKSIQYIQRNIYNKITLQTIANDLNVSCNYLGALFKKEVGKTINTYIKEMKISEAKNLIDSRNYTFIEIAEMLSFSSQSYFHTIFKEVTQITPHDYKNRKKKIF